MGRKKRREKREETTKEEGDRVGQRKLQATKVPIDTTRLQAAGSAWIAQTRRGGGRRK